MHTCFKQCNLYTFSHLHQDCRSSLHVKLWIIRESKTLSIYTNKIAPHRSTLGKYSFRRTFANTAVVRNAMRRCVRTGSGCIVRVMRMNTAVTTYRATCYKIVGQPRFWSRRLTTTYTMLLVLIA